MVQPLGESGADSGVSNNEEALASILEWSYARPAWQRDALRRLCLTGEIDEDDLNQLTELCMRNGQGSRPLKSTHIPDPRSAASTVRLRRISSVTNVNALRPGEELSFNTNGLTVIYGDNGSGKSGYARVLKKACRSRSTSEERILPNIYEEDRGPASATIDYRVDSQGHCQEWTSDDEHATALLSVSVFDAATASVHVDALNDVAYKPFPMKLLEDLADVCRSVRSRLRSDVESLEQQRPAIIMKPPCHPGTAVHQLISQLDFRTPENKVRSLAMLTAQDRMRLTMLEGDLGGDSIAVVAQLDATRNRLENIAGRLAELETAVSSKRVKNLCQLYQEYVTAQKAARVAARTSFGSDPLPGVGTDVWRALWEAARKFSEEHVYLDSPFPVTGEGSRCVLCHQALESEAKDRLSRFDSFVRDEAKRVEEEKRAQYQNALNSLRECDVSYDDIVEVQQLVRGHYGDTEQTSAIRRSGIMLKWRLRAALRLHVNYNDSDWLPSADSWPSDVVTSVTTDIANRIRAIQADEGSSERLEAQQEYQELKDRAWLTSVVDDVMTEINRLGKTARLRSMLSTAVTQAITIKSREISGQLVTDALRAQFAKEINRLGVANLAVELQKAQAAYGVPRFRISLIRRPNQSVGSILSEGEHRCIALCAFLAELVTTEGGSGIVFDDPVSSLDHSYRAAVATRLAELGRERQVIIFTHDIAFLFLLEESCREAGVDVGYRCITRGEEHAGICEADPPARAKPLDRVVASMEVMVSNVRSLYESGRNSEWEDKVDALARRLRTTWERAVEEAISPVFRRLSNKVETRGLVKLTAISTDDCRRMRDSYGRCSSWLHSSADALNIQTPSPDEVQAEIDVLRDWIAEIRSRQRGVSEN